MNITAIRVGRTFNLGNYESRKVEIEVMPDNGQTFDEAMAEVNAIVEAQGQSERGATTKPKPKPASSAPPLATGAKSEKADPTVSGNGTGTTPPTASPSDPPFEPGRDVAAEPKPKKRGRPRKTTAKPDHEKELQYALDSETLEELLERFNNVRKIAPAFGSVDNWGGACRQVHDRYKQLNTATADPAIQKAITDALVAESTAIAEKRAAAA